MLGETLPIIGTPNTLNYRSARVPGRKANTLQIPLSGATLPSSLKRIDLVVEVAGRRFEQSFQPTPNQTVPFEWNGVDAFGRSVQGFQPASIKIGYAYAPAYATPAGLSAAFARFSGVPFERNPARTEIRIWQEQTTRLGGWTNRSDNLGAWSLNTHHAYDPVAQILYQGDGSQRSVQGTIANNVITTLAGNGTSGFSGDGGPATKASLQIPYHIAVGADGSLYISDFLSHRIRRVSADGIITTVAGNGTAGFSGDGGPATQARLNYPNLISVVADGSLYISDMNNNRTRQVSPNGIITTVAGNGAAAFNGDGGPAAQASLSPTNIVVGADGSLYISDANNHRIRRVSPLLPGFNANEIAIPSEDGTELYRFDATGRHLATLNALTGATLLSFAYDTQGRLSQITDGDGLMTQIERDALGNPTAIVAPFGQRTTLALDSNGYLAKVTSPASESHEMLYSADGLLASFKDPRGNASTFTYDVSGRLLNDVNASAGGLSLSRTELTDGHAVAVASALNRITIHTLRNLSTGDRERKHTQPDNTTSTTLEKTDGTIATTEADGTLTTLVKGPDPRFSMLSPITKSLQTTTGGLTSNLTGQRTAVLADTNNPLSLTKLTESVTLNGRTQTTVYDAAIKTFTSTSPAARQTQAVIDSLGRVTQSQTTGILPVNNSYDPQGRPATIVQGSGADERLVSFAYNPEGYLDSVTDPLGRQVKYQYDLAGRVTWQILPDNREILFSYDANGNLTSLLPPGRPGHRFTYTPVNLTESTVPPDVAAGSNSTLYRYNLDKQPTQVQRPDGQTIDYSYDSAGRTGSITVPEGNYSYSYNPTTGKLAGIATPDGLGLNYTFSGALPTQTGWTGSVTGNVGKTYDNDFRISTVSVNGANPFTYQYDNDSLLTAVNNTTLGINFTLTRDTQNGLLTGTALGSLTDSYSYNGFGEVTGYLAKYATADLYKTDFSRDKLGRIIQKIETVGGIVNTFDYAYDVAGRLVEVKQNGTVQSSYGYGYDDNGNRTDLNGAPIAHYDAQDRLLDYSNATYDYTANGELKSKTVGSATTAYHYDVLGNLRQVILPNGTAIDYVIDGQNRRIGKKRNNVLEQGFLYQDPLKPIAELDGNGAVVSRFVYATGANVPDFMIKGGVTYRLIKDHLGSPRLVVDIATDTVIQQMSYDVWGKVIQDSNPGFQPFGFAGGLYDRDTKLVRFGARDYDAETGRWTAKDPIGFAGGDTNLYGYVVNDPVNRVDPNGLLTATVGGTIRVPGWVGRLIPGYIGQGASAGVALQFTDSCGNFSPDLGVYWSGQAGGEDYGIGRGTLDFGLQAGSIADLAGRGADISAHWGAYGGTVNFNDNGEISGGSFNIGAGYNIGGAGSIGGSVSIGGGVQ